MAQPMPDNETSTADARTQVLALEREIAALTAERDTAQALATVREIEADRVTAERDQLARMAQLVPEEDAKPTLREHSEGLRGTVKGEFPDSPADPKAAE